MSLAELNDMDPRPFFPQTWTNWREALRVVAHRPYLKSTTSLALSVG